MLYWHRNGIGCVATGHTRPDGRRYPMPPVDPWPDSRRMSIELLALKALVWLIANLGLAS